MSRKRCEMIVLVLVMMSSALALVPVAHAQTTDGIQVAVAITPLGSIVEEIGGENVRVVVLLPEGVEPHSFSATPQIIDAAESSELIVLTGHFPWEEDILAQTDTPDISIDEYEEFGASLSQFPGETSSDHLNPHGYWLLPRNALAIANATRVALSGIDPANAELYQTNFDRFVREIEDLQTFIAELDTKYQFSQLRAVTVFPAEAYIAETFGIEVVAVLQEGENIFVSGTRLIEIQQGLTNGSIDLIIGSDIGDLQTAGEFARQLASDTGKPVIWWRAVFTGATDYASLLSYDLGVLVNALELRDEVGAPDTTLLLVMAAVTVIVAAVAIAEGVVIVRRAQEE